MNSDPLIGRRFGNFQLQSVIGRGGMATVYRARQQTIQRDVAVKVIKRELIEDEEFIMRFEREAKIFAELQHPHIVPVIEFGHTEDGWVYIVFQIAEGGGLDKRIRRHGPVPVKLASKMLAQVGSALTFAHKKGIIHRDIKTSNILLDNNDNAYLTDFGIAKMLASTTRLTRTDTILGTPAYMSPEQWRGGELDVRSDIYSLGIIAYEMLSGDLPFTAETPFTLMHKHVHERPPSLRIHDVPDAVEQVILRAIAKNPDARFQAAEDFAQALADAIHVPNQRIPDDISISTPDDKLISIQVELDSSRTFAVSTDAVTQNTGVQQPTIPSRANATIAYLAGITRQHRSLIGLMVLLIVVLVVALLLADNINDTGTSAQVTLPGSTPTAPAFRPGRAVVVVISATSPVYRHPQAINEVLTELVQNERREVIAVTENRQWYRVDYNGQAGWIAADTVRLEGDPTGIPLAPNPPDSPLPSPDVSGGNSPLSNAMTQHAEFDMLGLEIDYPQNWNVTVEERKIILEASQGIGPLSGARLEIRRGTLADLSQEFDVELLPDASPENNIRRLLTVLGASQNIQPAPLQLDFVYPSLTFYAEANRERHYLIVVRLPDDELLTFWATTTSLGNEQRSLQEFILVPITTSIEVDGVRLVAVANPGSLATPPDASPSPSP